MNKFICIVALSLFCVSRSWGADGDIFTDTTIEGVELSYQVISEDLKTCQLGATGQRTYPYGIKLTQLTIPEVVNGYTVTHILAGAFSNERYLTSITLPESVVEIGQSAFSYCSALSVINLPSSLTTIGIAAFRSCSNLKNLDLPESLTTLGDHAFSNAGISSVTIPSAITTIGEGVFYACSLNVVNIPSTVKRIEKEAFYKSTLQSLLLPASIEYIGDNAFGYMSNLKKVRFLGDVPELDAKAFMYIAKGFFVKDPCELIVPKAYETNYSSKYKSGEFCGGNLKLNTAVSDTPNSPYISNGVVYTYKSGSYEATGFDASSAEAVGNKLTIAADIDAYYVTRIGDGAFSNIEAIESVTVPNTIGSIGQRAFDSCTRLQSISFNSTSVTLGDYAFRGCTALGSIAIPVSIKELGPVFQGCTALKSASIPSSVKQLRGTFSGCTSLATVYLNSGLTTIDEGAFANTAIVSVTIPSTVTSLSEHGGVFKGCSSLESVNFKGDLPLIGTHQSLGELFEGVGTAEQPAILVAPSQYQSNYQGAMSNAMFYGGYFKLITSGAIDGVVYDFDIDHYIASDYDEATAQPLNYQLVIAEELNGYPVTHIGYCGFNHQENLTSIIIPATIISIDKGAFASCSNLTTVTFKGDVPELYYGTCFSNVGSSDNPATMYVPAQYKANYEEVVRQNKSGTFDGGYFTILEDPASTGIQTHHATSLPRQQLFFDLQGRRVMNPSRGLFIQKEKKYLFSH